MVMRCTTDVPPRLIVQLVPLGLSVMAMGNPSRQCTCATLGPGEPSVAFSICYNSGVAKGWPSRA